ncbi:HupE/UreJ family protein [Amphritea balenae]|uniref:HupE/UreJ family protein n=1 Tax=Amphritea balenae TaxID=452629 RepID=A0A3P1SJA4_9GAMM|nr:HupE/UreJ family protein [Amphritea balenae]RRC96825.1 HupE/UreJ family protein [Amphritea balenae]GGK61437.1 protein hupE [Amphritea balenae]
MKFSPMISTITAAALLASTPAFAHTGDALTSSTLAGFLHPLTGMDHLLAMLAIGGWAAWQTKSAQIKVTLSLFLFLLAGFGLALSGIVLPMIESTIALSVLISGLLLTVAVRLPTGIAIAITAIFALAHGQAHGLGATGSILLFIAGFMSSSAVLYFTGMLSCQNLRQQLPALTRIGGSIIAMIGGYLLLTT